MLSLCTADMTFFNDYDLNRVQHFLLLQFYLPSFAFASVLLAEPA